MGAGELVAASSFLALPSSLQGESLGCRQGLGPGRWGLGLALGSLLADGKPGVRPAHSHTKGSLTGCMGCALLDSRGRPTHRLDKLAVGYVMC